MADRKVFKESVLPCCILYNIAPNIFYAFIYRN
jgi:hypothetical protein